MTPAQIQHALSKGKLAAIVTTRNATFWLVDEQGRDVSDPESTARYELVEWDDGNEFAVLRTKNQIRNDQFETHMYLSYGPIDELIIIPG